MARARDARHATELYRLGASDAIPETIEASLQLAETVLVDIGVPMGHVIASIHEKEMNFVKCFNQEMSRRVRVNGRVEVAPGAFIPNRPHLLPRLNVLTRPFCTE